MYKQRLGTRAEYLQQEGQRVRDSLSLSEKFRQLKSLTVHLAYYSPDGVTRGSEIRYEVNLANAKSVFRFSCPNTECVQGDFDLSEELADAVDAHRATATGEMACQGWLSRAAIDKLHCHNILRYRLSLTY